MGVRRSLGRRKAIFNGSGAGALGLLGSAGCAGLALCAELEVCAEVWLKFGPLPVLLPGSGGAG